MSCQGAASPLRISWSGLDDLESGVVSVEWAVGTDPVRSADDLLPFRQVGGSK